MSYTENGSFKSHLQLLMSISATLADYTQKLELCREIPDYLSRTLNLEPLTLAVVRETSGAPGQIVLSASSGAVVPEAAAASLEQTLLDIYRLARQGLAADEAARAEFEGGELISEVTVQRLESYPRATVFLRYVDPQHRMLLIVHRAVGAQALRGELVELLHLVADQLAKLCACLMIWAARPAELGAPFSRLTDREWMVLRGLNSDAGEKQLADQLGLSPHTLHSHIKSIYRKVGVQGRLPLLLRAEEAMRGLRADRVNQHDTGVAVEAGKPAIRTAGGCAPANAG